MKVSRTGTPINRVKCIVRTCAYYKAGDYCVAENIEVQPKNAHNSQDTDCSTFAPKE